MTLFSKIGNAYNKVRNAVSNAFETGRSYFSEKIGASQNASPNSVYESNEVVNGSVSQALSGKGSAGSNADELVVSSSKRDEKANPTEKEIIDQIKPLLKKAGFEVANENDIKVLMAKFVGVNNFKDLIDLDKNEINKIVECLKYAVNNYSYLDEQEKIKNIKADVIEYLTNGRVPGSCEAEQDNVGLIEKMEKVLGKSFKNTEPTYQDLKDYYNKLNSKWNKFLRTANQYRKFNFGYDDNKRMLRDFTKMLRLTESESLKKNLMLVISDVIVGNDDEDREYKINALKAGFMSLSIEGRMEMAEDIHRKGLLEQVLGIKSEKWNKLSDSEKRTFIEGTVEVAKNFSEEYAQEAPKVDNQRRKDLKQQRKNIEADKTLTEEERRSKLEKIDSQLECNIVSQAATEYGIVARNNNISKETKVLVAESYTNNDDGVEITENVAIIDQQYKSQTSEERQQEFTEIMDKATEGEYSKIVSEIENGSDLSDSRTCSNSEYTSKNNSGSVEYKPESDGSSAVCGNPQQSQPEGYKPVYNGSNETQTVQVELVQRSRYEITSERKSSKAVQTEEVKQDLKKENKIETMPAAYVSSWLSTASKKEVDELFSGNVIKAVKAVLNCAVHNTYAHNKALDYFSILPDPIQEMIAKGLNPKTLAEVGNLMSIASLEKVKCNSYYTEKIKEEILENKKEATHYAKDNNSNLNHNFFIA